MRAEVPSASEEMSHRMACVWLKNKKHTEDAAHGEVEATEGTLERSLHRHVMFSCEAA
jgi:hypothetical protein